MNSPFKVSKENFFDMAKQLSKDKQKVIVFIIDIDNSKSLFGEEINENIVNEIFCFLNDKIPDVILSQVGRDAFSGLIFDNREISVFEMAKIKEDLQEHIKEKLNLNISFCMGISIFPELCKEVDNVFSTAFESLLVAKQKGPNSMESAVEESMKLKSLYFRKNQMVKLSDFSEKINKSESYIIRRALDDFFEKYNL